MRSLARILAVVYGVVATLFIGALTNWFRYSLSLEAMTVAVPLLIGAIVVAILTNVALRRDSSSATFAIVPVAAMTLVLAFVAHHNAFGSWLPALRAGHVEDSGTATLDVNGRMLLYRLELSNPFSRSHRETLVIKVDGTERRFSLPLFNKRVGAYVSATTPSDWITLRPTQDREIFVAEIGSHLLVDAAFQIDLRTNRATLLSRKAG